MAAIDPDDIPRGLRMDNLLRDADYAQSNNWGHVSAARGYAGPPRWTRTARQDSDAGGVVRCLLTFGSAGWNVPFYVAYHAVILAWFPPLAPATVMAIVCLAVNRTIRSHGPGDTRYAGLRAALQIVTLVILIVRWSSEFVFGFEANAWWLIFKLPDSVRLWGDLDPTLRVLLADPMGLLLTVLLVLDLWLPQRLQGIMTGGGFWTRYHAPSTTPEDEGSGADCFYVLTFVLLATPKTVAEATYALALGLGVSFLASYIIVVESADILSIRRQSLSARAQWFARRSHRRYQPLMAIGSGLPRLLIPFAAGLIGIWVAGPGSWQQLLPIATLSAGLLLGCPRHFATSWQAIQTFATYPGHRPARAGVHDLSPAVRASGVRGQLLRLAILSWIPFVHGAVSGLLPGMPTFDGWAVIWPDLRLKSAVVAVAILVFVPPQLVCGVLRTGFAAVLDRIAPGGQP